ncbi:MAG: hypothetical protein AABW82_04630 [Nanoarchaeota archaeon]
MENKSIIISSIIGLLIIIGLAIYFFYPTNLSPETKETCNQLYSNPSASINLLFFASENQTKEYIDYLLSTSPLNKLKESFNVFYIDEKIECEYYKEIALYCYSRDLIRKASACPNDYIFVLNEDQERIRSSSYLNVMSINTKNPKSVITHEFSHSFANLAEEYTPANLPRNVKNCVKDCSEFNELNEGCFQGCSESNYYRSIDSGLMKTLYSTSLGKFNEFLIESKIKTSSGKTITGNAIQSETNCENQFYYLISANYSSGSLTINDRHIEQGCTGKNGEGSFSFNILNENFETLAEDSFNPELIFTDSQQSGEEEISGETYNYEGELYIRIPTLESAKTLEIYDKTLDKKIATLQIDNIDGRPCKIE